MQRRKIPVHALYVMYGRRYRFSKLDVICSHSFGDLAFLEDIPCPEILGTAQFANLIDAIMQDNHVVFVAPVLA